MTRRYNQARRRVRALLALLVLAPSAEAFAQPTAEQAAPPPAPAFDTRMPAIDGGLEITVALSGAETTGDIGDGMTGGDLIGSAGQLDLEIGHRLTPFVTIGFYSNAQALTTGSDGSRDVYTGAAGVEADFHFRPSQAVDPWVSVGTGVRAYLVEDGDYTIGVGAELARLQVGADFRLNDSIALGPVLGASATLYGAEKQPMQDFHELSDKGINWTFTAGVAGRFNLLGTRR